MLKKIAKDIVFPTLMGLKADKWLRNRSSEGILNVMYHGVVNEDSNYFTPRHIIKEQFEKQIIYLKNNFEIITVNEAFKRIKNGETYNHKTLTISFDDGFKNNLDTALPILEKHNVPVTFFIASLCTLPNDVRCTWAELIATLHYFNKNVVITLGDYNFINLVDEKHNLSMYTYLKDVPYQLRDQILSELTEKYNLIDKLNSLPEEIWQLVSNEELKKLSQSPLVTIGSHGHLHYNLGNIEIGKATEDMMTSKSFIENTIDQEVNLIAYPDGSYNDEVKDQAEKIGYKGQLAVTYKCASDLNDLRIMNRHGISSTTTFESNMLYLNYQFKNKAIIPNIQL